MDKEYSSAGKIVGFYGIKGEVRAGYTHGREKQLGMVKEFILEKEGERFPLKVESLRFHKGQMIIKFATVDSVDDANDLKGFILKVKKSILEQNLEEDEFLIADLVGLPAYDKKMKLLGTIKFVADQGSGSIISIENEQKKQYLVPFVKDLVPVVDIQKQMIVINNIPGLVGEDEI